MNNSMKHENQNDEQIERERIDTEMELSAFIMFVFVSLSSDGVYGRNGSTFFDLYFIHTFLQCAFVFFAVSSFLQCKIVEPLLFRIV